MSSLIRFRDFLKEGKQVGLLYHITPAENVGRILIDDELKTHAQQISFSRDKRFWIVTGKDENSDIRFVIDGDKLSHKYKIVPTSGYKHKDHEAEERIYTKAVKPLSKYLLAIEIIGKHLTWHDLTLLRSYLGKHPHIKISSTVGALPIALRLKDLLKSIEGFYWRGDILSIDEYLEKHPHFEDWDGMDRGAAKTGAIPAESLVQKGVIFVDVVNEDPLKIKVCYHKDDHKSTADGIVKGIEKKIPEANVYSEMYEEPTEDRYDDD